MGIVQVEHAVLGNPKTMEIADMENVQMEHAVLGNPKMMEIVGLKRAVLKQATHRMLMDMHAEKNKLKQE
ncbi:hypothetical protein AwErysi_06410 [Erysipelotrichaceae bacterium]|nr:hypothetical protein AwErysi_06410 [Erysipelotrichaceae bacterium]